jgi:hypothetical protein
MKSRLILQGQEVDLKDDISVISTFMVSDETNIGEEQRSATKTIVLPPTQRNRKIFQSIFSTNASTVDLESSFDPRQRIEAQHFSEDTLVFDGLFQLKKLVIIGDSYEIHGVLFSNILTISKEIGDTQIAELGWKEYDHILNATNIVNSWSVSIKRNGADSTNYTSYLSSRTFPKGYGYYYGVVDWGLAGSFRSSNFRGENEITIGHNEIVPMIYFKEILWKIAKLTNLNFDIKGFESDLETRTGILTQYIGKDDNPATDWEGVPINLIDSLLLSWEGGTIPSLSASEITARRVDVDGNATTNDVNISISELVSSTYNAGGTVTVGDITLTTLPSYLFFMPLFNEINYFSADNFTANTITDPSSQWVSLFGLRLGRIRVANGGNYRITIQGEWNVGLKYTCSDTGALFNNNQSLNYQQSRYVLSAKIGGRKIKLKEGFLDNPTSNAVIKTTTIQVDQVFETNISQGSLVQFHLDINPLNPPTPTKASTLLVEFTATSSALRPTALDFETLDKTYLSDATINVSSFLPKMTVKEFLKGFIQMFNFVVEDIKDDTVTLSQYDGFFGDPSEAIDWTDKIDRSKPIEIIPASMIEGKIYNYKFAEEDDALNERYFLLNKEYYGSRKEDSGVEWQKGEKVINLPFANSVMQELASVRGKIILPRIFENGATFGTPYSGSKARIFLHNGIQNVALGSGGLLNRIILRKTDGTTSLSEIYGSCGHLYYDTTNRGGSAKSFDLLFSIPRQILFTVPTTYNTENLWSYHRKRFEVVTSVDQRIMTAFVNLNERDISILDFKTPILIDGSLWKINKVIDYVVDNNFTTKVEFLKYLIEESAEIEDPTTSDPPIPLPPNLPSL